MDKQKQVSTGKKRGTLSWIMEFAGSKQSSYALSVILAILSVISGFIPYVFMANIVRGLLEKTADFSFCLTQCLWMALFFLLDRLFHAASTTMSHKATFEVLANIRRRLTKKLARMPLGDVLDESSGTYKNIIVERVDSIETTLAHMIPEVTSNLILPFVIFAYMLRIDWRLALLSLITVPFGALFFMLMMVGGKESYENTVVKTKALNDTAVEYIGGIEVIKAFGKAKSSYEKFVTAAKEGADCSLQCVSEPGAGPDARYAPRAAALRCVVLYEGVRDRAGSSDADHPLSGSDPAFRDCGQLYGRYVEAGDHRRRSDRHPGET